MPIIKVLNERSIWLLKLMKDASGYPAELYDDIFKMIALNESCKWKLNSFQYF